MLRYVTPGRVVGWMAKVAFLGLCLWGFLLWGRYEWGMW